MYEEELPIPEGVEVLDQLAAERGDLQRRLSAIESEKHDSLVEQLVALAPGNGDVLRRLQLDAHGDDSIGQVVRNERAFADQQHFLDQPSTSAGLSIRGKPFDFEWTVRRDFGSPRADRTNGTIELAVSSANRPFDSDAGHTFNAAGIGVLFRPIAKRTAVRFAPYLNYNFKWHDDSSLRVARNRGDLNVLVRQRGGVTLLKPSMGLWNDGTSWYQEHQDERSENFADSNGFLATSDLEYEVWFWFNSSIDFHRTSANPFDGSSQASNSLFAQLGWIVFEQTPF